MSKALDYATRMAIGQVVAEEMRSASMFMQLAEPQARQLHGPCSIAAEEFIIGSVLASPPPLTASRDLPISKRRRARERETGPSIDPRTLRLQPSDFWAHMSQRYWRAMLDLENPTDPNLVTAWLWERDLISGPEKPFVDDLNRMRDNARDWAALRDVAGAAVLILDHARSRRLVGLLARLADGICGGSESHASAQLALREHFMAERGPLVKPSPDEPTR